MDREVDREEIHYMETQAEMGKVEKLMEKAYVKLLPMAMRKEQEGGCRYVVISLSKILTSTSRFWTGDYQEAIRASTGLSMPSNSTRSSESRRSFP